MRLRTLLLLLALVSCDGRSQLKASNTPTLPTSTQTFSTPTATPPAQFSLKTAAFADGQPIPKEFTCDGSDTPPPLSWSGAPAGTVSFAIVVDDPDAPGGTFTHWTIWNIDAAVASIEPQRLPEGVVQGMNSFSKIGYEGPCPPKGDKPHHYVFTLTALNDTLALKTGASVSDAKAQIAAHKMSEATLTGTFAR